MSIIVVIIDFVFSFPAQKIPLDMGDLRTLQLAMDCRALGIKRPRI